MGTLSRYWTLSSTQRIENTFFVYVQATSSDYNLDQLLNTKRNNEEKTGKKHIKFGMRESIDLKHNLISYLK